MTQASRSITNAVAFAIILAGAALTLFSKPNEASAQGATCYMEWCSERGTICWSVVIECPG
jgi:hypothetical protein